MKVGFTFFISATLEASRECPKDREADFDQWASEMEHELKENFAAKFPQLNIETVDSWEYE